MRVVCTAGHVDHGKSTLVRALTGMEPDRFAEERDRGLTIDLGFAWFDLAGEGDGTGAARTVAFVDLPGHERFVGNMLAGAGAVDVALFVVAADEGWMPQSAEHLEILDLLGVRHGLVALTKADLVDVETLELGAELVREQLEGTTFAAVPIVPVSAAAGTGLDDLRAALAAVLGDAGDAPDRGRPRLWVDRAFSIRGAGTVVTGTLAGGALATGEDVALAPGGRGSRVRGLQALGADVAWAAPGGRLAVNLVGVDRSEVVRGDAVVRAGQWLDVEAFDAWVRPVEGAAIARRGAWHLHVGSAERLVRVQPVSGAKALAGPGFLSVEVDGPPLPLVAGDRFVLREAGRRATLGGGVILDADTPPRPRGAPSRAAREQALQRRLAAVRAGDAEAVGCCGARERGAVPAARLAAACGLTAAGLSGLVDAGRLVRLGEHVADPSAVERWAASLREALAAQHAAHPVERTAPRALVERAVTGAGCPGAAVPALLDHLVTQGLVAAEGPGYRLPEHRVELDADQRAAREDLLRRLAAEPFAPPPLPAAAQAAGASPALVRELEAAGDLVRLEGDLAVVAGALDDAAARLRRVYAAEGPLSAARAKEALGTSRKYALPLLAELDRRGVTRRLGDVREVR